MPDNIIDMGHITGAFGILGWVKIKTETDISNYPELLLSINGKWTPYKVEKYSSNDNVTNVKFTSITNRDEAIALKGTVVGIKRQNFPNLSDNEYYQADLIGLNVTNIDNQFLGKVENLMDTGANAVLIVKDDKLERMIPFVSVYVISVNLDKKQIIVDWGLDY
jgi:16S rRNA processing protein RimM